MKAVTIPEYGGPEVLAIRTLQKPHLGPEDIGVRVRAAGVNRADCLQREGLYPMPPNVDSLVPGLELAGEVDAIGSAVSRFKPGDRVFGLVSSGGCAEYACIDQGLAVPIPANWDFTTAASVIEVFCTANETVFEMGGLRADESILIHAGASGVGTAAVQLAKHEGATVLFTAGSRAKIDAVIGLGADHGILYKSYDFVEEVLRFTAGVGVDQVEDFIGADYLMRNLAVLKAKGRLVLVGLMGGDTASFHMGTMLRKRLAIFGFTMRAQSIAEKRAIVDRFESRWMSPLSRSLIKPIIYATFPLTEVSKAHEVMEHDENVGKIVLTVE